jgi:hypothetical protein
MRAFRLVPNVVLTGEVKEQAEGNEGGETSWGQTMTDSPMYLERPLATETDERISSIEPAGVMATAWTSAGATLSGTGSLQPLAIKAAAEGALRSARSSTLEKCLTPPALSETPDNVSQQVHLHSVRPISSVGL